MEILTSSNVKVIEESSKAAQPSKKRVIEASEKVQQLQKEVKESMADFRTSSDKNTSDMNKDIVGFWFSLQAGKQALSTLRTDIKLDNTELNTSISEQITNLQNDFVAKNKIMDALVEQTQKMKVLTEKLKNATQNIAKIEEERSIVKRYTSEINQCLLRIVETHDSSFTVSVRQNLSEKLQHVFAMPNQLHGVSGSGASTKQGGDEEKMLKNDID